jgi:RNA polymerase sigma factor (sigma-70 family)
VGEDSLRIEMTTATITSPRITPRPRRRTDGELARAAGHGDTRAFEALYERHHRGLLSFSRHMLGGLHDAEDVVQHTFVAADAAFRRAEIPKSVRAWLYTVARNRCISIIRAHRDDRALPDPGVPSTENLAEQVEQAENLRELLADLRMLPDDQRAALLLAELGELSHAEVAQVIGVRTRKVKALVYQARQALMSAAGARAIPCRSIREELAAATGAGRRRRHLRDHVVRCEGCRAYADRVAAQRASIAAILPVAPTVALREGIFASLGAAGATAATGGASAGLGLLAANSTAAKLLAITAIGGAAAGGATVAVTQSDPPRSDAPAVRGAEPSPARHSAAGAVPAGAALAAPRPAATLPGVPAERGADRRGSGGPRANETTKRRATAPAGKPERARGGARAGASVDAPRGHTLGHAKQKARGRAPAGRAAATTRRAGPEVGTPPKPPAVKPAHEKPSPPGLAKAPKPPPTAVAPPAGNKGVRGPKDR